MYKYPHKGAKDDDDDDDDDNNNNWGQEFHAKGSRKETKGQI
jgi:hypothetical protein